MIIEGSTVKTPAGIGKVKSIETYSRLCGQKRYCVELEASKEIKCYFEKDVLEWLPPLL